VDLVVLHFKSLHILASSFLSPDHALLVALWPRRTEGRREATKSATEGSVSDMTAVVGAVVRP
jgi:hypothetical protein